MGTKSVRLDEDVYERVKSHKRADETMSEAIERLIGGASLLELQELFSAEEVAAARDAIDEADRRSREDVADLLDGRSE